MTKFHQSKNTSVNFFKAILLFFLISNLCFAQTKVASQKKEVTALKTSAKKYTIKGTVMKTGSYCGGAQPSKEMMEEASRPYAYSGKIFYLRKGNTNTTKKPAFLSFKTDSAGRFNLKLIPGVYSIIQELQIHELNLKDYEKDKDCLADNECLKKWWKTPYHILIVKDKDIELNFTFHHPCFLPHDNPCLQYTGPLPP